MRFNLICLASFWDSAKIVLKDYPLAKSDLFDYLDFLSNNPGTGDQVPGYAGKVWKDRWPLKTYKIGKSGGLRIYYYFHGNRIAPFFIFSKRSMADAPQDLVKKLVDSIDSDT